MFVKIVYLQANIRQTFFDQRSPQQPELGVLRWRRQTDKQTDGHGDSMTESSQTADSGKIFYSIVALFPGCSLRKGYQQYVKNVGN